MPVFNTACPRNCYSTCSMKVSVIDGRLRMIEPNPENKATPEGICLKGLSYIDRAEFYNELDLITPTKQMKQDFEKRLADTWSFINAYPKEN